MEGYKFKEVHGTTIHYHNGLIFTPEKKEEVSNVMSRCWDSLTDQQKIEANEIVKQMRIKQ